MWTYNLNIIAIIEFNVTELRTYVQISLEINTSLTINIFP